MSDPFTARAQEIRRRKRWRTVRRLYLDEHPVCEHHEAKGETVPAVEVDHVVSLVELLLELVGPTGDPSNVTPAGAHDFANLQALCVPCHAKKSAIERARGYNDRTR